MKQTIIINGDYDTLNKMIGAMNHNRYVGAGIKKRNMNMIARQLPAQVKDSFNGKWNYFFNIHRSNERTDKDNLLIFTKYFFDAMQEVNLIENDGWKQIGKIGFDFFVDVPKGMEYVEVVLDNE